MTIIQSICLMIYVLALIAWLVQYRALKALDQPDCEWVEYERRCHECGEVCYHYDNKPYSMDRVIYCGKHCHMYNQKD